MTGRRYRPAWMAEVEAELHKHHVDIQRLWKRQPQTPAEWAGDAFGNLGPTTTSTSSTTTSTTTTSTTPNWTSTTPTPNQKCCNDYATAPTAWFIVEAGQIAALDLTEVYGHLAPCNCGILPGDSPIVYRHEADDSCWYTSSGYTTAVWDDDTQTYIPTLEELCGVIPSTFEQYDQGNRWGVYFNRIYASNPRPFGQLYLTNCCVFNGFFADGHAKLEYVLTDGNPCLFETLTFQSTAGQTGATSFNYGCWANVPVTIHLIPL